MMTFDELPELPEGWKWEKGSMGTWSAYAEDNESVGITHRRGDQPEDILLSRGMSCAPIGVFVAVALANGIRILPEEDSRLLGALRCLKKTHSSGKTRP